MTAICNFLMKSPVPTLLADVFYYLTWRNANKGGMVACCAPLLYTWLQTHLPNKGPFMDQEDASWPQRLGSLRSNDISWYSRECDGTEIISSCGDFPNIPLIGTRGCINANPVLYMRQLGYPMEGPSEEKFLEAFLLHDLGVENLALFARIKKAWEKVNRKGTVDPGKKNCITKEPYFQWIKERVRSIKMPFKIETSSLLPEPKPTHVPIEEAEGLRDSLEKLTKENEELLKNLHVVTNEKNEFKWKLERNKTQLQAERGCREKEKWWKLSTKQKKEIRETLEVEIADLSASLCESKERAERERRSKESALAAAQITPDMWKGKCQEAENANEWERYWRGRYDSLL
ncbi:uncharacterized protein LOC127078506 [Lathyrus oleraceus]|uniref:uncharacterized protein LOC127078506 n=1 Tax=Pisum sativum TaxID=3888 RepID=UPI0021D0045D|nr:uncharacterized protein LOC127078506 [Pisum sativum]